MYRNCQTRPIIADQLVHTCDELNNVLTGIMLKAGMVVGGNAGLEIESLSMRAKTAVQNLRVIADGLQEHHPKEGELIGIPAFPDRK